jgi:hypothetical protein
MATLLVELGIIKQEDENTPPLSPPK